MVCCLGTIKGSSGVDTLFDSVFGSAAAASDEWMHDGGELCNNNLLESNSLVCELDFNGNCNLFGERSIGYSHDAIIREPNEDFGQTCGTLDDFINDPLCQHHWYRIESYQQVNYGWSLNSNFTMKYSFEESDIYLSNDKNDTMIRDRSCNYDLTLLNNGVTIQEGGILGHGLLFDGSQNSKIDISTNSPFSVLYNDFSLSLWVKPTSLEGRQELLHMRSGTDFELLIVDGLVVFSGMNIESSERMVVSSSNISLSNFTHIVITKSSIEGLKLYINSNLHSFINATEDFIQTMNDLPHAIGYNPITLTNHFIGMIDEVTIIAKVLNEQSIINMYNDIYNQSIKCFGISSMNSTVCSGNGQCHSENNCICKNGYYGFNCFNTSKCNGLEANHPQVCNGHGVCNISGECTCHDGFDGFYCEHVIPKCYQILANNPLVCNRNGYCMSEDNCTCINGYTGYECQDVLPICNGLYGNDLNVCSGGGHGHCNMNNTCECHEGYEGIDCSLVICFNILSNNSMVCSGHGTCYGHNSCECMSGYYGNECQYIECNRTCSGNGYCNLPNQCSCYNGYTGTNCELAECEGKTNNDTQVCNGHGKCFTPNNCTCYSGWMGHNCSEPICIGSCSMRGQCIGPNQCSCYNGYTGTNCELAECDGIVGNDVCSGHGNCTDYNVCTCMNGYNGTLCNIPICFGIEAINIQVCNHGKGKCIGPDHCVYPSCNGLLSIQDNVCNGNGECVSDDECVCNYGYFGHDCKDTTCFSLNSTNSTFVCGGRGECIKLNECKCNDGYTGSQCQTPICESQSIITNSTFNCSNGNGKCIAPNTCSCSFAYLGEYCEEFACNSIAASDPSVCSGHGNCSAPNTCTCEQGYTGTFCNVPICSGISAVDQHVCSGNGTCVAPDTCIAIDKICFGINATNHSNVCSGHGLCFAPDTCSCHTGYSGLKCEIFTCSGYSSNSSVVCSGHGTCISPNTCSCHLDYTGSNCEIPKCNSSDVICSNHGTCIEGGVGESHCECIYGYTGSQCEIPVCNDNCNNQGNCTAPDTCTCIEGVSGNQCQIHTCNFIDYNNVSVCSGHGNCTTLNQCNCHDGWTGSNCDELMCYGIKASNKSSVCYGHGQCLNPNTCLCSQGYGGDECNHFICVNNCSMNNGECIGPNTCQCKHSFTGIDCSIPICNGKTNESSNVCSGHGSCMVSSFGNVCVCEQGYFGLDCEIPSCNGTLATDPSVCHGRGNCSDLDNCTMCNGYQGSNCEISTCFGYISSHPLVCNGHGTCQSINTCQCEQGYFGLDCEISSCNGTLATDPSVCHGRGNCSNSHQCTCIDGYSGTECQFTKCYGLNSSSEHVCSGNGECLDVDQCYCKNGYTGFKCDIPKCFEMDATNNFVCSGHGTCTLPNICMCEEGYTGRTCQVPKCFEMSSACSGHGTCVDVNTCQCSLQYTGFNCEIPICFGIAANETIVCSGVGQCQSPNQCQCSSELYYGNNCQFTSIQHECKGSYVVLPLFKIEQFHLYYETLLIDNTCGKNISISNINLGMVNISQRYNDLIVDDLVSYISMNDNRIVYAIINNDMLENGELTNSIILKKIETFIVTDISLLTPPNHQITHINELIYENDQLYSITVTSHFIAFCKIDVENSRMILIKKTIIDQPIVDLKTAHLSTRSDGKIVYTIPTRDSSQIPILLTIVNDIEQSIEIPNTGINVLKRIIIENTKASQYMVSIGPTGSIINEIIQSPFNNSRIDSNPILIVNDFVSNSSRITIVRHGNGKTSIINRDEKTVLMINANELPSRNQSLVIKMFKYNSVEDEMFVHLPQSLRVIDPIITSLTPSILPSHGGSMIDISGKDLTFTVLAVKTKNGQKIANWLIHENCSPNVKFCVLTSDLRELLSQDITTLSIEINILGRNNQTIIIPSLTTITLYNNTIRSITPSIAFNNDIVTISGVFFSIPTLKCRFTLERHWLESNTIILNTFATFINSTHCQCTVPNMIHNNRRVYIEITNDGLNYTPLDRFIYFTYSDPLSIPTITDGSSGGGDTSIDIINEFIEPTTSDSSSPTLISAPLSEGIPNMEAVPSRRNPANVAVKVSPNFINNVTLNRCGGASSQSELESTRIRQTVTSRRQFSLIGNSVFVDFTIDGSVRGNVVELWAMNDRNTYFAAFLGYNHNNRPTITAEKEAIGTTISSSTRCNFVTGNAYQLRLHVEPINFDSSNQLLTSDKFTSTLVVTLLDSFENIDCQIRLPLSLTFSEFALIVEQRNYTLVIGQSATCTDLGVNVVGDTSPLSRPNNMTLFIDNIGAIGVLNGYRPSLAYLTDIIDPFDWNLLGIVGGSAIAAVILCAIIIVVLFVAIWIIRRRKKLRNHFIYYNDGDNSQNTLQDLFNRIKHDNKIESKEESDLSCNHVYNVEQDTATDDHQWDHWI